jgi:hypothetical protein
LDKVVYDICEKEVLLEYNTIKEILSNDSIIICQHIGTFTQEILISFVSLIENSLMQSGESKFIQRRLIYLIIECIQNIIFHSDKLPDNNQLAYMIISKNDSGYSIHTSNTMLSENIDKLIKSIDELLKVRKDVLSKLFTKKMEKPEIDKKGRGGIGLLTMISKSGKNFNYKVSNLTKKYSLFHIEINIKN